MQWHTPMGYRVQNGQIVVDEEQSKIVKQIFMDYDNGISTVQIANTLKENGVMNKLNKAKWTHATVGRMLENYNYLGNECYPKLIDTELFKRVQEKREQKRQNLSQGKHRPAKKERVLFSGVLRCGSCGEIYTRIKARKKYINQEAKWKCKNYVYHNRLCCAGGFISDRQIMEVCVKAINQIVQDKSLILKSAEKSERENDNHPFPKRKIINEDMDCMEDITAQLYDWASEKYKTLKVKDEKQRTEEMLEILKEVTELKSFDEDLYKKLIKEIVVYKDSSVKVIFLNESSITISYEKEENGSNQQPGRSSK